MTPTRGTGTVAWAVFAHRDAPHVRELVARLVAESPDCEVIVHISTTAEISPDDLADIVGPNVRFSAKRFPVYWGGASLWIAMRWMLDDLARSTTREWIGIVAGDAAPIRPLAELQSFLATMKEDGVMAHVQVHPPTPGVPLTENQKRYFYRYRPLSRSPEVGPKTAARQRYIGLAVAHLVPGVAFRAQRRGSSHMLGIRRWRCIFDEEIRCYKGGPFGIFRTSMLGRVLLQNPVDGPVERHFREGVLAEEATLLTMILRDTNASLLNRELIAGFWEASQPHPAELNESRAAAVFADSLAFFSRKTAFDQHTTSGP